MATHPYASMPDHQRWSAAMGTPRPDEIDPVVSMAFRIASHDKVATAGSCFAQHISRHLAQRDFTPLVTESAHPLLPPETALAMQYGGEATPERDTRADRAGACDEFQRATLAVDMLCEDNALDVYAKVASRDSTESR